MKLFNRRKDIILYNDSSDRLESLAWDLAAFEKDFDDYEFRDNFGSLEEAASAYLALLRSGDTAGFLSTLSGIGVIDYDSDLERRRRDLISRVGRL